MWKSLLGVEQSSYLDFFFENTLNQSSVFLLSPEGQLQGPRDTYEGHELIHMTFREENERGKD